MDTGGESRGRGPGRPHDLCKREIGEKDLLNHSGSRIDQEGRERSIQGQREPKGPRKVSWRKKRERQNNKKGEGEDRSSKTGGEQSDPELYS